MIKAFTKNIKLFNKDQKKNIIIIIFFQIITVILEVFNISLIIPIISTFTNYNYDHKFLNFFINLGFDFESNFFFWVTLFLFIYLFKNLFYLFTSYFESTRTYMIGNSLSNNIVKGYLYNQNFLDHDNSEKIQVIFSEVKEFIGNFLFPLFNLIRDILIILALMIFLALYNLNNFLVITSFLFVVLAFYSLFKKYIFNIGKKRREADKSKLIDLQNILFSLSQIKIYARETYFFRKFKTNNYYQHLYQALSAFFNKTPRIFAEILLVTFIMIFIIQSPDDLNHTIFVNNYAIFFVVLIRFLPLISRINVSLNTMRYARTSFNLIFSNNINFKKKKFDNIESKKIKIDKAITLKNIHFSYGKKKIFNNHSFRFLIGKIYKITGNSGSGKSTLINLICGLLTPNQGEIEVDGTNIKDNLSMWRLNIGIVPQNIYLYSGTVRDNIVFGEDEDFYDYDKALDSIKQTGLSEKFNLYDIITENGQNISGGEKQRIAISRALYNERKILIFDEPTSALDAANKIKIEELIFRLSKDRLIFVVSHDNSFLSTKSEIIDLNKIIL